MKDRIKINERLLRISHWKRDWIPIYKELSIDQEVKLEITAQVSGVEYETNNDGTVNEVYVIKGLLAEDVKLND